MAQEQLAHDGVRDMDSKRWHGLREAKAHLPEMPGQVSGIAHAERSASAVGASRPRRLICK